MLCCQCQYWRRCRCYNERHADDKKLTRLFRRIGSLARSTDAKFCKHGLRVGDRAPSGRSKLDYRQSELFLKK